METKNEIPYIGFRAADKAVFDYFDIHYPLVIDGRKVPVVFATPERWNQIQRDSFLRDNKGQLILPAIAIRRGSPEQNKSRHVPKKIKETINGQVIEYYPTSIRVRKDIPPIQETNDKTQNYQYLDIPYPRFININYNIIIWASYFADLNAIQERYLLEGTDHKFYYENFLFTGYFQGISDVSNNEDMTKQERIQKIDYSLILEAYLLDNKEIKTLTPIKEIRIDEQIEPLPPEYKYKYSVEPDIPDVR